MGECSKKKEIALVIEAFYGGSHKQLMDTLCPLLRTAYDVRLVTLPERKWHWKARCGVLSLLHLLPSREELGKVRLMLTSSVLSVAELVGLRPELARAEKLLYFHESQLQYPRQAPKGWDAQFAYNQITSCLAADRILFNSNYAMKSFLELVDPFLKVIPDAKPKNIREQIEPKCSVIYFPLELRELPPPALERDPSLPLHIIWPHRWEHDKNPGDFFDALYKLLEDGVDFRVSVIGRQYGEIPGAFSSARSRLSSVTVQWGPVSGKAAYWAALRSADVVVSTAAQETFGVAVLEATALGCLPLCPRRLVYPELFPDECLYNTQSQLTKRLASLAAKPAAVRSQWERLVAAVPAKFDWRTLRSHYALLFHIDDSECDS